MGNVLRDNDLNEILFSYAKSMSGTPIRIGTVNLQHPPIIVSLTVERS